MKVHLVSEHASPLALLGGADAGGQNVHVAALARGLARLGDDVVVHTRRDDPSLARRIRYCRGVVVDHVDAGPPGPLPKDKLLPHMAEFARGLERRWRVERPDVVHAHFWMSGLAAVRAAHALSIPVALTYHALGIDKRRHQGEADTSPARRVEVEARLARSVDLVIATTDTERATLIGLGARPDRVQVVPCGVDLDLFCNDGQRPVPRRVVCIGRFVARKGFADVIHAVAALPDVDLLIAGGPPAAMLSDDPHARHLEALAHSLGIADRVHLMGALDRHDVPALLRSAEVVCCTPWYEPFGLVAVEAMACGVPVIASKVGGLAETVVDGQTGLLVPPRSPSMIRIAIETLLDDPNRREAMGAAARRRAQRYGWDQVAQRSHQLLRSITSSRAPLPSMGSLGGGAS